MITNPYSLNRSRLFQELEEKKKPFHGAEAAALELFDTLRGASFVDCYAKELHQSTRELPID